MERELDSISPYVVRAVAQAAAIERRARAYDLGVKFEALLVRHEQAYGDLDLGVVVSADELRVASALLKEFARTVL